MLWNSVTKLLVVNLILISSILLVLEIVLRANNYEPGMIVESPLFEQKVDSLIFYPEYIADEGGITTLNTAKRDQLSKTIAQQNFVDENRDYMMDALVNDYVEVNKNKINNAFNRFIDSLTSKPLDKLTGVDSAYLAYCQSPVNSDGFRSIEFKQYATHKPRILLLGDSFTYGAEASNITNSFADYLSTKNFVVYNSGIIAADPAQYLGVAEKYIPQLKPDVVVVNFTMANDIVYFKRSLKPNQPLIYATNAGLIFACPEGEYMTCDEAYNYILNDSYIPNQDKNWFYKLCAQTVITTAFWVVLVKLRLIPPIPEKEAYLKRIAALRQDKPVSDFYIKRIKKLAKTIGATFVLACIPNNNNPTLKPANVPGLFENITYHFPEHFTPADRASGGHFNDSGYRKYAEFIVGIIDSVVAK